MDGSAAGDAEVAVVSGERFVLILATLPNIPPLRVGVVVESALGLAAKNSLTAGVTLDNNPLPLFAAGAGAGLSAAFNSPLAGLVFVLEELQGKFASLEFFSAALACLTADMVCRGLLGQFPVFHITLLKAPDLILLLVFIPLGMLAGLLGVVFNKTLLAAQKLNTFSTRPRIIFWLICGLAHECFP